MQVLPVELIQLPHLEKLYVNNNKLTVLPSKLGELRSLKVLRADNNMLSAVPGKTFVAELQSQSVYCSLRVLELMYMVPRM